MVPALEKKSKELNEAAVAEDKATDDFTPEQALTMISNLKEEGFEIRTPYAKASYRQGMIESSIGVFKRCLKVSQLPGSCPFTIVTFTRACKLSANLMKLRPICLLPPQVAYPEELNCVSPTAL